MKIRISRKQDYNTQKNVFRRFFKQRSLPDADGLHIISGGAIEKSAGFAVKILSGILETNKIAAR